MLVIVLEPVDEGRFAKVDNSDFWNLADFSWHYSALGYAERYGGPLGRPVLMHRQIMGLNRGDGLDVDHINGDKLDNRRKNLRICTRSQNRMNSKKPTHRRGRATTSRFKGVSWDHGRWRAALTKDRKTTILGHFTDEMDAALAYDAAAREHYGEFARLNFPREGEQAA